MSTEMQTTNVGQIADVFTNYERALSLAEKISKSDIIPTAFRGKPANVFVALEFAARVNLSPLMIMQECYVVNGSLSQSGKLGKALIDNCGLFLSTEYVIENRDGKTYCWLRAFKRSTGALVDGPEVCVEELTARHGKKWNEIPALMMRYRAAAYFLRAECPAVAMGLISVEEAEEIAPEVARPSARAVITAATPLVLGPAVTTQPADPAPVVDVAPPSEPAATRVDAPAPVARSAPKGTPLPPIDEMLAALPDRFDGVDDRVWEVFSERAVEAVQTAASPEPQSVEAEMFVAAMTKTIGTVYVYHTDPVRWSGGKKRPATPQNLEDELARALGMVGT